MKIMAVQPRKMGRGAFSRVDQEGRLDEEEEEEEEGEEDMMVVVVVVLLLLLI